MYLLHITVQDLLMCYTMPFTDNSLAEYVMYFRLLQNKKVTGDLERREGWEECRGGTVESSYCWSLAGLFRSNTDITSSVLTAAEAATEQLNEYGMGDPTVVLAAVGLRGIPPTQQHSHISNTRTHNVKPHCLHMSRSMKNTSYLHKQCCSSQRLAMAV